MKWKTQRRITSDASSLCRDDFNRQNLKVTMNQNLCCLSLWQTSSPALTGVKDGKPCHLDMDVNVSVCRHNRLQQLIAARFRQTCMFFCTYWLFLNTRESSLFLKQSFSLSVSLFFSLMKNSLLCLQEVSSFTLAELKKKWFTFVF